MACPPPLARVSIAIALVLATAPAYAQEPAPEPPPAVSTSNGVPLAVTLVVGGLALASGGLLVASAVDAQSLRDDLGPEPSMARLDDLAARDERTLWLVATTSILTLVTVVLALLTDTGDDAPPLALWLPGFAT